MIGGYDAAMVTFPLPAPRATLRITLPWTREDVTAMFTRPSVIICAMICGTMVVGGALFSITWLALHDKGTEAIGALLLGVLGLVLGRVKAMHDAVRQVQAVQTVQVANQEVPGA